MAEGTRKLLIAVVVALFVAIGILQVVMDPIYFKVARAGQSESGNEELLVELPGQFIIASMAGFKEVIAGALWVRADTFFHEGNYEAIIPIVRLVTWLDPRNIDVFTTGAWHLDYNFVDDETQLSDKRYIPASIALLKEGIRNNPNIWDLYFELGWTHYNKKMMDHENALKYIEEACKRDSRDPNTGRSVPRPEYVDRMLAHAYEKAGRFDDAVAQWRRARANVEKLMAMSKKNKDLWVDQTSLDICDRNLMMLLLRLGWRYGDMKAYGEAVEIAGRLSKGSNAAVLPWAAQAAKADYERRLAAGTPPSDALKPLQTGFEVSIRKLEPRKLLVKGSVNLVPASEYKDLASEGFTRWYSDNAKKDADQRQAWRDGCRVFWRLEDYDYKMPEMETFDWKIDKTDTIQWDSFYVAGGKFGSVNEVIDVDNQSDPEMYPLTSEKYRLTIWFSPQDQGSPDYVHDRIGWRGDALRSPYLDKTARPGYNLLRRVFVLDRALNVIGEEES